MRRNLALLTVALATSLVGGCDAPIDVSDVATKKYVDEQVNGVEQRGLANLKKVQQKTNVLAEHVTSGLGSLNARVGKIETRIGGRVIDTPFERADAPPGKSARSADPLPRQESRDVVDPITSRNPLRDERPFPVVDDMSPERHIWRKDKPFLGYGGCVYQIVKDLGTDVDEDRKFKGTYPATYRYVTKLGETTSRLQARMWCWRRPADGWPEVKGLHYVDVERSGNILYLRKVEGYRETVDARDFPTPDELDPADAIHYKQPIIVVPPPIGPVLMAPPQSCLPPWRRSRLTTNASGVYPYSYDVRYGGHRAAQ